MIMYSLLFIGAMLAGFPASAFAAQQPEIMGEEHMAKKSTNGNKKSENTKDGKAPDIFLNFENTSLDNVVNYMARLKNIDLLPDKGLADVKVSLTIRKAQTLEGAWKIFLTLLEVSGFSIIEVDGLHKVVPKEKKLTEALPYYINEPYTTLPDSDLLVRYVVFLENLEPDSIKDLLVSLLSDKHLLVPFTQAKCFIITDRCYNIKAAMKIIQELDSMGQPETAVVIPLKFTNAVDVKALFEGGGLLKKADTNPLARIFAKATDTSTDYFPAGTKIVPEERTNSLILMGAVEPIKKIEKFITEYIDVESKAAESPLHIYPLQYAEAGQIAEILKEVTATPEGGPGASAAKYGAIRGGVKYFKSMKILPDKEANRLVVSCTDKQDWQMIKSIIRDLDKPQPQVAIETLFVSVDSDDLDKMGGSIRNPDKNTFGGSVNAQAANFGVPSQTQATDSNPITLLGSMLTQLISTQGSTLLSFGSQTNIWAIFEMLRTRSNTTILSQPFITIANKVTGKITVGQEQNILLQNGGSAGVSGYGAVSANTALEITPQINLDGVIRLGITVDIDNFTDNKGGKDTKKITTNVTMADGQVLVLGGFVKTHVSETTNKTPLLSNIPILGWFFKGVQRDVKRTYIFVFMAPTIIKPRSTPGVELYSKMKLHAATSDIEDGIKTIKSNDPLFNWFFDPKQENYSHKVVDFANARYQPSSVDLKNDPYYKSASHDSFPSTTEQAPQPVIALNNTPSETITVAPTAPTPAAPAQIAITTPSPEPTSIEPSQEMPMPIQQIAIQPAPQVVVAEQSIPQQQNVAASRDDINLSVMQQDLTPTSDPALQGEVLSLLNDRMQQQRLVSVEDPHLASQRKKLKSLITQTYNNPNKNNVDSSNKQAGLKTLLAIPTPTQKSFDQQELVIDSAKRNSLKDFLLQADKSSQAARNNPT